MKINNFRGDLTDVSAKKEALVRWNVWALECNPHHIQGVHLAGSSGPQGHLSCFQTKLAFTNITRVQILVFIYFVLSSHRSTVGNSARLDCSAWNSSCQTMSKPEINYTKMHSRQRTEPMGMARSVRFSTTKKGILGCLDLDDVSGKYENYSFSVFVQLFIFLRWLHLRVD